MLDGKNGDGLQVVALSRPNKPRPVAVAPPDANRGLPRIHAILTGDLSDCGADSVEDDDAAPVLAAAAGVLKWNLPAASVTTLCGELVAHDQVLQALAVLKVLSSVDPGGGHLIPILDRILEREALDGSFPGRRTMLVSEFLGRGRARPAFAVLLADRLEVRVADSPEPALEPPNWLLCHDPRPRLPEAPHGLLLVWNAVTEIEGESRRVGRRAAARRNLVLGCRIFIPDGRGEPAPVRRLEGTLMDASSQGAGIRVALPPAWPGGTTLRDRRVRLEIPLPSLGRDLGVLGDVCWWTTDANEEAARDRVVRFGVRFDRPPAGFLEDLGELMRARRGDQHLLWNLWSETGGSQ